jgi:hypothetical protein
MSKQTSKNPPNKNTKKGTGLSKRFIQKMAEEMLAVQAGKYSNS